MRSKRAESIPSDRASASKSSRTASGTSVFSTEEHLPMEGGSPVGRANDGGAVEWDSSLMADHVWALHAVRALLARVVLDARVSGLLPWAAGNEPAP